MVGINHIQSNGRYVSRNTTAHGATEENHGATGASEHGVGVHAGTVGHDVAVLPRRVQIAEARALALQEARDEQGMWFTPGHSDKQPGVAPSASDYFKSFWQSGKNFVSGATVGFVKSTVKGMFCGEDGSFSLWQTAKSLALVGTAAALCLTPAAPLVIGGLTAYGLVSGGVKLLENGASVVSNYAEGNLAGAEEAAEHAGQATTETGLAVLGVGATIKAAKAASASRLTRLSGISDDVSKAGKSLDDLLKADSGISSETRSVLNSAKSKGATDIDGVVKHIDDLRTNTQTGLDKLNESGVGTVRQFGRSLKTGSVYQEAASGLRSAKDTLLAKPAAAAATTVDDTASAVASTTDEATQAATKTEAVIKPIKTTLDDAAEAAAKAEAEHNAVLQQHGELYNLEARTADAQKAAKEALAKLNKIKKGDPSRAQAKAEYDAARKTSQELSDRLASAEKKAMKAADKQVEASQQKLADAQAKLEAEQKFVQEADQLSLAELQKSKNVAERAGNAQDAARYEQIINNRQFEAQQLASEIKANAALTDAELNSQLNMYRNAKPADAVQAAHFEAEAAKIERLLKHRKDNPLAQPSVASETVAAQTAGDKAKAAAASVKEKAGQAVEGSKIYGKNAWEMTKEAGSKAHIFIKTGTDDISRIALLGPALTYNADDSETVTHNPFHPKNGGAAYGPGQLPGGGHGVPGSHGGEKWATTGFTTPDQVDIRDKNILHKTRGGSRSIHSEE